MLKLSQKHEVILLKVGQGFKVVLGTSRILGVVCKVLEYRGSTSDTANSKQSELVMMFVVDARSVSLSANLSSNS